VLIWINRQAVDNHASNLLKRPDLAHVVLSGLPIRVAAYDPLINPNGFFEQTLYAMVDIACAGFFPRTINAMLRPEGRATIFLRHNIGMI